MGSRHDEHDRRLAICLDRLVFAFAGRATISCNARLETKSQTTAALNTVEGGCANILLLSLTPFFRLIRLMIVIWTFLLRIPAAGAKAWKKIEQGLPTKTEKLVRPAKYVSVNLSRTIEILQLFIGEWSCSCRKWINGQIVFLQIVFIRHVIGDTAYCLTKNGPSV